jgi:hypothetical protein
MRLYIVVVAVIGAAGWLAVAKQAGAERNIGGKKGVPPQPPMFRKWVPVITFYYKSPDPALGPAMLKDLLQKENIDHPWFAKNQHVLNIISVQLGDIAAGKPKIVRAYEAEFTSAPLAGRRVIARTLMNCGDKETLKQIDSWLADPRYADVQPELQAVKKYLEGPKHKHVRDRTARSPEDLDFLWSNFFITGQYVPVSRILDVLDLPDTRENAVLKRVARWSLGSNLQQHPKLVQLVTKHAGERPAVSRKVIEELTGPKQP